MRVCGICQRKSIKKLPRNMFVDKIGNNPPILISELLMKFISEDSDFRFVSNEICCNCTRKMSQYYSAKQLMEKIKAEIIDLIQSQLQRNYNEVADCDMQTAIISTRTPSSSTAGIDVSENNQKTFSTETAVEKNELDTNVEDFATKRSLNNLDNNENKKDLLSITCRESVNNKVTENLNVGESLFIGCDANTIEYDNLDDDEDIRDETVEMIDKKSTIDCSQSKGVPTFRSTGKGKPTGIKCEFCDKVYENHKTFEAHKKYGYGFSGYVCELCGTTLYSKSGFTIHTKSHQAKKEFQCTECGAQFHRKTKLTHHLAWHKGEKPFQCEICAKCFVHRVALTKHRHIHSDATKRNECKICGNKFRTLTHLTRHMTIHTGAKPFSCPVCGKCFSQAYNMKTHIKQHENPRENTFKRYRCQKCLKSFVRFIKYEEHATQCV